MTRMTYVVVPKMLDCATWILDAKFLIIIGIDLGQTLQYNCN